MTPRADLRAQRRDAALAQPGAKERADGKIKFACPACLREGHDKHQDNAAYFPDNDRWGCAWATSTEVERQHWDAISGVLRGAERRNGHGAAQARGEAPHPRGNPEEARTPPRSLVVVGAGDFLAGEDPDPDALIEGVLSDDGGGWLGGEEKLGKSWYAIE